jgi:radical SAM-linked protein
VAVDFAINGDLRFLSHQETLRVFARAVTRAALPLRLTEGFNPRPRMSLPLPRPVGVASDAERLVIELAEALPMDRLSDLLTEQMPVGITIQQAHKVGSKGDDRPLRATYRVEHDGVEPEALAIRAAELMRFEPIPYERFVHKEGRRVRMDLRPYLDTIDVAGDGTYFSIHVTGGGSARPSEVCHLLGYPENHVNHLIRRLEVAWQ